MIYINFFIVDLLSVLSQVEGRKGEDGRRGEEREGEEERKENMVPMTIIQFRAPFFNEVWLGEKGY